MAGFFLDDSAASGFVDDTAGVSVRVKDFVSSNPDDGLPGIDGGCSFLPEQCLTTSSGVQCKDRTTKSKATFARARTSPNQVAVSFKCKNLDVTPPFFGPVQVIVTYRGTIHRKGAVTDCRLYLWGIKCREP